MNTVTVHHPVPGETSSFTVFSKPMGQMQYHCAETGDRGGAIIVTREEALALAAAFAELAKDIEGAEKIAAQVRAINGQEDAA
jgi:hypothetical protein